MPRKASGGGGGRSYVNNAMNRSLGRVGMAMGSAPVSRSSGGGSSYGSSSGSSSYGSCSGGQRSYVDNSMNRSLGRVGMSVGSMPVSRSSGASLSSYSSRSEPAQRTYVDNSMNRNLGRAGMPVGSSPVSRSSNSSSSTSSSQQTYVDNSMNRSLGRVGMPVGSAVVSKKSQLDANISTGKTYADNSFNRLHGRVGKPLGTAVISSNSISHSTSSTKKQQKCYVDNPMNRRLGRVGMPLGSMPISSNSQRNEVMKAYNDFAHDFAHDPGDAFENYQRTHQQQTDPRVLELVQEMFERMKVWEQQREAKNNECMSNAQSAESQKSRKIPFASYEGPVISYSDIDFQNSRKPIGSGGFGAVYAAKYKGKMVAVKKLRVQRVSRKRLAQFEEEVRIFAKLDHKNVISFYGACIKTPNLCMVMEIMEGSLYDKLHVEEYQFTAEENLFITKEIANGLEYLHSMEIAHCDVKSSNILLDTFEGKFPYVKLTDFGLSMMKNDSETTTSTKDAVAGLGTPRYSSPEVLRGEFLDRYQMKMADVYSFGLVVFEIFSEEEPFDQLNLHQLRAQVGFGGATPSLNVLAGEVPIEIVRVMKECWLRPATARPVIENICGSLKQVSTNSDEVLPLMNLERLLLKLQSQDF